MNIIFYNQIAEEVLNLLINKYHQNITYNYDINNDCYLYLLNNKVILKINRNNIINFKNKFNVYVHKEYLAKLIKEDYEFLTGDLYIDLCLINLRKNKDFDKYIVNYMRKNIKYRKMDLKEIVIDYTGFYVEKKVDELESKDYYIDTINNIEYYINGNNNDLLMNCVTKLEELMYIINPVLISYIKGFKLYDSSAADDSYSEFTYISDGEPFISDAAY